jgi:hypothetical protein
LIPQPAIEVLYEAVLLRHAGRDVMSIGYPALLQPAQDSRLVRFRVIVTDDGARIAARGHQAGRLPVNTRT